MIRVIKNLYKNFVSTKNKQIKPENFNREKFKKTSYSQCGEDLIVDYIFKLRGVLKPSFIDIGANHPYYLNNTYIFYNRGSRGINIDANPTLINKFNKIRNEDKNINIGIGVEDTVETFFIMSDNTLSTFSKKESNKLIETGVCRIVEKVSVKITTIRNILSKYCNGFFPDFLSIDVEGLDFDIIKSIDFSRQRPKVICIEIADFSPTGAGKRNDKLVNYLVEQGYYEYANTNLNAIMVDRNFWFNESFF